MDSEKIQPGQDYFQGTLVCDHVPPALKASLLSHPSLSLACFNVVKLLDRGCASQLFIAEDRGTKERLVLKQFSLDVLSPMARFQADRELRIHARLNHPNVLPLYAAFTDGNLLVLVLPLIDGGDLYSYMSSRGLLTETAASKVMLLALDALHYLHLNGVIHRDIKPENALVITNAAGELERLLIFDFGLSIQPKEERPVTRLGTTPYMSPEVLHGTLKRTPADGKDRDELVYGRAVDVWALGVLCYEMLHGNFPFGSPSQTAEQMLGEVMAPVRFRGDISSAARSFILSCLKTNPQERADVTELLHSPFITDHRPVGGSDPVLRNLRLMKMASIKTLPIAVSRPIPTAMAAVEGFLTGSTAAHHVADTAPPPLGTSPLGKTARAVRFMEKERPDEAGEAPPSLPIISMRSSKIVQSTESGGTSPAATPHSRSAKDLISMVTGAFKHQSRGSGTLGDSDRPPEIAARRSSSTLRRTSLQITGSTGSGTTPVKTRGSATQASGGVRRSVEIPYRGAHGAGPALRQSLEVERSSRSMAGPGQRKGLAAPSALTEAIGSPQRTPSTSLLPRSHSLGTRFSQDLGATPSQKILSMAAASKAAAKDPPPPFSYEQAPADPRGPNDASPLAMVRAHSFNKFAAARLPSEGRGLANSGKPGGPTGVSTSPVPHAPNDS